MKKTILLYSGITIIFLFFVTSCAGTKFLSVWKDETYSGGAFQKILIVGVSEKPTNRRVFEDELVKQLKSHGTDAVSSATVLLR
jgi:hypothetical protein